MTPTFRCLTGTLLILTTSAAAQTPVNLGVQVGSPKGPPTVSWTAAKGGTQYQVERWMTANPRCCRAASPWLGGTSWLDQGLSQPGSYTYRVTVRYADGTTGYSDQTYDMGAGVAGAAASGGAGAGAGAAAGGAAAAGGGASGAAASGAAGAAAAAGGGAAGAAASGAAGGAAGAVAGKGGAAGAAGGAAAAPAGAAAGGGAAGAAASGAAGGGAGAVAGKGGAASAAGGAAASGAAATGAAAGAAAGGAAGASASGAAGAGAGGMTLPTNPSGLSAKQLGPGQVRLSWPEVKGISVYLLTGPGLPRAGVQVQGTSYDVGKLSPGAQRWSVGSVGDKGGMTPASAFATVDLIVK